MKKILCILPLACLVMGNSLCVSAETAKMEKKMNEVRVIRARKIYSDGCHNAFTTLAAKDGAIYLAFRSAVNHMAKDGSIRVLKSSDNGENWKPFALISKPGYDLRDPHLMNFKGELHLFCFGLGSVEQTGQAGVFAQAAAQENVSFHMVLQGDSFSPPELVNGIPMIWGLAQFNGELFSTAYTADYNVDPPCKVALYSSTDGTNWSKRMDFPFPGNEAAIDFDKDGTLWALVRDSSYGCGCIPTICRIDPPYNRLPDLSTKKWDYVKALQVRLTGPMIKRFPGACLLVGRMWDGGMLQRRNLRTDIFLIEDGGDVQYLRTLPSGGDTSYAAFLEVGKHRGLLSYYSSHEHKMDLPIPERPEDVPADPAAAEHSTPADIFLAELSYRIGE